MMKKTSPVATSEPIMENKAHGPHCDKIEDRVRILRPEEYKGAAQCLAEAFVKDGVVRYCIDTPDHEHWSASQRWDLHVKILEYITYAHCLAGLATAVGPDYSCVALW